VRRSGPGLFDWGLLDRGKIGCHFKLVRGLDRRRRQGRDGKQYQETDGGEEPGAPDVGGVAMTILVEDGEEPPGELGPSRHREARGSGSERDLRELRRGEQLLRIRRGPSACRKDDVVARMFTLDPGAIEREPRERVEPVQRAGDPADAVRQRVAPRDVGELVDQDVSPVFAAPVPAFGSAPR
jgi:hypothetical protein